MEKSFLTWFFISGWILGLGIILSVLLEGFYQTIYMVIRDVWILEKISYVLLVGCLGSILGGYIGLVLSYYKVQVSQEISIFGFLSGGVLGIIGSIYFDKEDFDKDKVRMVSLMVGGIGGVIAGQIAGITADHGAGGWIFGLIIGGISGVLAGYIAILFADRINSMSAMLISSLIGGVTAGWGASRTSIEIASVIANKIANISVGGIIVNTVKRTALVFADRIPIIGEMIGLTLGAIGAAIMIVCVGAIWGGIFIWLISRILDRSAGLTEYLISALVVGIILVSFASVAGGKVIGVIVGLIGGVIVGGIVAVMLNGITAGIVGLRAAILWLVNLIFSISLLPLLILLIHHRIICKSCLRCTQPLKSTYCNSIRYCEHCNTRVE